MNDEELQTLIEAANSVRLKAYAPYSRFLVGAALRTQDDQLFVGCNVENVSFGLTLCAERVAASTAVAAGSRQFREMVLVTTGSVAPCGACRQFLSEFNSQLPITLVDAESLQVTHRISLAELLPYSFDRFESDS